jgi:hypothetical protein
MLQEPKGNQIDFCSMELIKPLGKRLPFLLLLEYFKEPNLLHKIHLKLQIKVIFL